MKLTERERLQHIAAGCLIHDHGARDMVKRGLACFPWGKGGLPTLTAAGLARLHELLRNNPPFTPVPDPVCPLEDYVK